MMPVYTLFLRSGQLEFGAESFRLSAKEEFISAFIFHLWFCLSECELMKILYIPMLQKEEWKGNTPLIFE